LFRIHESTPDSESLVLTDHKNNYFTKIGGTQKIHGSNFRGASRTQRPSTKNPTNNLKLQSYSINSIFTLPIFSKFQLWNQIWQWSSTNFVPKFKSYNLQLITFPKRYLSCIKIEPLELEISSTEDRKTSEIDWNPHHFFIHFHTYNWRYLQFQWIDFG
jgi:hypothetical protein